MEKIFRDDLATQAAALAFYTALALAPLLVLLLSVLSTFNLPAEQKIIFEISQVVGPEASNFIETLISSSKESRSLINKADFWGILVLMISASAVFLQIQTTLNLIFGPPPGQEGSTVKAEIKTFIIKRLLSFIMVFFFVFVMVASLLISVFINLWIQDVGESTQLLHGLLMFGLYALIFTALFQWLPDRTVSWRAAFEGGLITAVLFSIGKSLVSWYLSRTAFASAYGAAGSFLMLLVWVYYSSVIIYIGAEIASVLRKEKSRRGAAFS